jgi:GWxTD domain-containing protein
MRRLESLHFAGVLLACILCPALAFPQEAPASQDNTAKRLTKKEAKKGEQKLSKELGPAYTDWLRNVVPEIMTDEERRAFLELSTNEERDQYIEIFWERRNPNRDSPENTFKEEHYRRLAYADEHFASGIPGRKTDRGRIYIIWGPPDEIESHPAGGTYDRPLEQGGGSSTAYSWELWRYRHLEDVGENIEIEFVDPSGSGEYHMTMDLCEKDALAHVPGAGPSLSELIGRASKADRYTNANGTTCPMSLGATPASMQEFEAMDRFFRVQRPPTRFKDLEPMVTAGIVASQIHLDYRMDFLRATTNTVLVPITLQVPNGDLSFQSRQGVHSAVLNLYGRITTPGGRVIQTFEDLISRDFPESLFRASLTLASIYQRTVPLRPGLYRLDVVIKDTQSGKIGLVNTALRVPHFEDDKLDASSLILADEIAAVPTAQLGAGRFVLGAYKVRPRLSQEFSNGDKLGIFLQLYNLKLDETSHKTNVSVAYRITKDQQEVWRGIETADHLHQGGEQLTIERYLPVASLSPGRYTIEVIAMDLLANETITRTAEFTLKPAPRAKPAEIPRPSPSGLLF